MKFSSLKKINLKIVFPAGLVVLTLLLLAGGLSAQTEPEDLPDRLLTDPFFRVGAEAVFEDSLTGEEIISPSFFVSDGDYRGHIFGNQLSSDRDYWLPDTSGEICLSAGNCDTAHTGTDGRLARFGPAGLTDSSVSDSYNGVAMTIDNTGRVGIGVESPQYGIHAQDRIQAGGDVCTDMDGGICLSELVASIEGLDTDPGEMMEGLVQLRDGHGETGRIPLWRDEGELGDSVIRQSAGRIGIGTSPTQTLDVSGTIRSLGFRMPVSAEEGYGLLSDDQGVGTWRPVLTPRRDEADVAEKFPVDPDCEIDDSCPQPGDLVSVTEGKIIRKSETPKDSNLIGVITTDPAITLGAEIDESEGKAVALIGRVPTKVSTEGGDIEIGDPLTSSNKSGVAKKATGGRVVGMALESFSGDQTGKIMAFINPHEKPEPAPEELRLTDQETGDIYCIQMKSGELVKEECK